MQPWPRRADVPAVKPYTLNYPDFCCLAGNEDFFDNNLVRCMFGAVCRNQISEEDFRDKLAELWGANPHIPMYYADWGDGNVSYIMTPGPWDIKIPGNWPDFPVYTNTSWGPKYNACKRHHGYQANNWTGVTGTALALGVTEDQRRFRNKLDTDIAFPVAGAIPHVPVGEPTGPGVYCQDIEPSNDVKSYYYIVQPGDTVYTVSRIFLPGARIRWEELRDVNYMDEFSLQEFVGAEGNMIKECFWRGWVAGQRLRIPSKWPDPDWAGLFPGVKPPIEDIVADNKYDNANKAVTSGLKWGLAVGGVVAVALIAGTVVLIRRT